MTDFASELVVTVLLVPSAFTLAAALPRRDQGIRTRIALAIASMMLWTWCAVI